MTVGGGVTVVGGGSSRGGRSRRGDTFSRLGRRATGAGASAASAGLGCGRLSAVFLTGGGSLASFSLRRRTTGASRVEDADRTNSPMSFDMVRTVLLSTPSSFASS